MAYRPRLSISSVIAEAVSRIERVRGFLDAARLSDSWLEEMRSEALVREAHHSTHIEGTGLTLEQSQLLLAGGSPRVDPDAARELRNYVDAFDLVAEYLDSGEPATEALVREIHRRLVRGVRGDSGMPGRYRELQNQIVDTRTGEIVYVPPPHYDVPRLMSELVEWLREERELHRVLVAGVAQFRLVDIHPFVDGNGRTARLLSMLCLYRSGYDLKRLCTLSEFYDRDLSAYYRALQCVRTSGGDLTEWAGFFVGGLADQLREVQARGERAIRRDALAHEHGLNERQRQILGHVISRDEIALRDLGTLVEAPRRTLQIPTRCDCP